MKTLAKALWFLLFSVAISSSAAQALPDEDLREAVCHAITRQLHTYPESTLRDIYKNFFQDVFGPGHIIADTAAARNYLRRELASFDRSRDLDVEPLGWRNNYYRVSLSLVKDGTIPYPVYFDAFLRSVNEVTPLTLTEWRQEWARIETIIRSMGLILSGYDCDREEIDKRLAEGRYVGHHSEQFNEQYAPHYRIIRKDIYEKEILPFIEKNPRMNLPQ